MSLLKEFSIQLYSVREETEKDFAGTIKKLGEIGYTGVEFAGYGDIPATEMKKLLDDNNIKSVGTHVGMDKLLGSLEQEIEYNLTLGTPYIICPGARLEDKDDCLKTAEDFNRIADKVTKAGMKFGYHNHAHEFKKIDDEYILDILFANCNPEKVIMELDMYWAAYAGVDPLAYMQDYKGRAQLLHVKQILDHESKKCVDLNEGVLDFPDIITKSIAMGVVHFILEQEEFAIDAFTSVKNGFNYIMSL